MKIAIVYDLIYPFSIGGAEWRNFSLGRHLVLMGHEVHLFGVKMWKGEDTLKISESFYAHGVSRYTSKYHFNGSRRILELFRYSYCLFFELLRYEFDLIDVSSFPFFPALSCFASSVFKKSKLVVTWHEVWGKDWNKSTGPLIAPVGRFIEHSLARISKNDIGVSKLTGAQLVKLGKRSSVIENWIDMDEIDALNSAGVHLKKYDVVSVGRHLRHKNFDMLLRIFAVITRQMPDFKALIIGEGPETEKLLRLKQKLHLSNVDILCFSGERKVLFNYLRSSRIFVLLSELEGFSIVSFEAMALGLPVICVDSERNGLKDYIEDGKNGFVCKKNEVEIVSRIIELLKDRAKLKKMGASASRFSRGFSSDSKIKAIERFYQKVMSG